MPPTLEGRQRYRRRLFIAGVVAFLGSFVLFYVALFAVGARAEAALPWLVAPGVVGFLVASILSTLPRRVQVALDGHQLIASWRKQPLAVERVTVGRWVLGGVDTACGLAVHLTGPGGRVVIGALDHDGEGYRLDAPPVRATDVDIAAADLDTLLGALGIVRDRAPGPLVVELTRSSQTAGGALGMMAPWFATIAIVAAFGLTIGLTGIADRIQRAPGGPLVLGGVTLAMVVVGLVVTFRRHGRVRLPELALQVTPEALVLVRPGGEEVARAAWSDVSAEPRQHVMHSRYGRYVIPVLLLSIGGNRLAIGAWHHGLAWPFEAPRHRSPRHLAGAPWWPRLVEALHARGAIRGSARS
ncbi:MAG: hypothetical protein JNL83_13355 [Myxococcales bacterium]|nr:hypothetical protein [Myxococcales bacterium]